MIKLIYKMNMNNNNNMNKLFNLLNNELIKLFFYIKNAT